MFPVQKEGWGNARLRASRANTKPIAPCDWVCDVVIWALTVLDASSFRSDAFNVGDLSLWLAPLQLFLADVLCFGLSNIPGFSIATQVSPSQLHAWSWRALLQGILTPPHIAWTQQLSETLVLDSVTLLLFHLSCLQKQYHVDDIPSSAGFRCSLSLSDHSCNNHCVFEGTLGKTFPQAAILPRGTHVMALSVQTFPFK